MIRHGTRVSIIWASTSPVVLAGAITRRRRGWVTAHLDNGFDTDRPLRDLDVTWAIGEDVQTRTALLAAYLLTQSAPDA